MKRLAAVPVALALTGAVVVVLWSGSTAMIAAAVVLMGSAAVIALSLVFLAIGRSEDRDRAAEEAARRPRAPEPEPEPEHPALDRRRPLPPRRGH
jgi:hypothetical protein